MRARNHVSLAGASYFARRDDLPTPPFALSGNGRHGTIPLSLEAFAARMGDPHEQVARAHWRDYDGHPRLDGAGKVSAIWIFETPRGPVEVGDYWWNAENELSIRGTPTTHRKAFLWFRRWCRESGVPLATV